MRPLRSTACAMALVAGCFATVAARAQSAASPNSVALPPASQDPPHTLLVAVDRRQTMSLDGPWHYIVDPYQGGLGVYQKDLKPVPGKVQEYDFAASPTLAVPGDWNTQRPDLLKYEGGFWYERHFDFQPRPGHRSYLHIGAANYRSRAYINSQLVCTHEGGFTPFDCEITGAVKPGDNSVVIYVDSTRLADGVPTLKTDWYNYGGLTRDVSVVTVPQSFIDDFDLHLDRATRSRIEGYVHVEGAGAGQAVSVDVPELKLHMSGTTDADGRVAIDLQAPGLTLWSPQRPKLYEVKLTAGADTLTDEMGFRTIETAGSKILLNGQPIVLNGVCIHAEAPYRSGRVDNDKDVATLFGWVKELGANYVRLAHYPHDERMTRAADKLGVLVWSEVPVYWAVQFDNEVAFGKSQQQLHEMVRRDRDKASVILWSIANETPNNATRTAFLTRSADYVHRQDPTRLVTAALLVHGDAGGTKYIDDPLGKALDVIGFNEYIGWYDKTAADADTTQWSVAYDKPLIVSEFGGEAVAGRHGTADDRWSEEFQADIYKHQVAMLHRIPQLRGSTAWVLMDFRSPVRQLPGFQDGFNRKGLVSDQGVKKQAFYVLQKAYQEDGVGRAN
jgi:beta-glucuronidase